MVKCFYVGNENRKIKMRGGTVLTIAVLVRSSSLASLLHSLEIATPSSWHRPNSFRCLATELLLVVLFLTSSHDEFTINSYIKEI